MVQTLAVQLGLWAAIGEAARLELGEGRAQELLDRAGSVPVVRSRALRTLGSYVFRGANPLQIRLQFAQEPTKLRETFLHELAHLFDHLGSASARAYRGGHGTGWRHWAQALGIAPEVRGHSESLERLRNQRMKLVAVCSGCGAQFHRLRRFAQGRQYVHRDCGSKLDIL